MLVAFLGLCGLILFLFGIDMQTLKKRDGRYRSGFKDTGVEAPSNELKQGAIYSIFGGLLMLPFGITALTAGYPLVGLFGGLVVWGVAALLYFNASNKIARETEDKRRRDEGSEKILTALGIKTDQDYTNISWVRRKSLATSNPSRLDQFRMSFDSIPALIENVNVAFGGEWWGDNYVFLIEPNIIPGEQVLRLSMKRRDGRPIQGTALYGQDVIFTADSVVITQSLQKMFNNQAEFDRLKVVNPVHSFDIDFSKPQYFISPYSEIHLSLQPYNLEKEESEVPRNATIIGKRFKHVRVDGNPDMRYKYNPYICNCTLWSLAISPSSGSLSVFLLFWHLSEAETVKSFIESQR